MADVPELRDGGAGIGAQVGANALAPGPWGSLHPFEGRFLQNVLQPLPPRSARQLGQRLPAHSGAR